MTNSRIGWLAACAGASALVATVCLPGSARASTASAAINGGSLGFVTAPGGIAFSATLTSFDQVATSNLSFDVGDARGTGAGWSITATSTTFTAGTRTLPTSATSVPSPPTASCDAAGGCTPLVNSGAVAYPYTLPAGTSAPAATKLVSAAAGSGLGSQTTTPTFQIAIPANSYVGTYNATWTFTLMSAP